jgi:hypothetical protein
MSLNDPENLVPVQGHTGRHTPQYHLIVFDRLFVATEGLSGAAYKEALIGELRRLQTEVITPGSDLNKMITSNTSPVPCNL